MEIPLSTVEQRVKGALQDLDDQWESIENTSASWTREVKNAIGRVGKQLGYAVYASQSEFEDNGEWLFDLAWFEEDGDLALDMPLAIESEWQPQGILEDFQKLLVSRARHRVMVFWQPTERAWKTCLDQLIAQVRRYRGTEKGDRYLLCCWVGNADPEQELQVKLFIA